MWLRHIPIVIALSAFVCGCRPVDSDSPDANTETAVLVNDNVISAPRTDESIVAFCGACHLLPSPTSFVKERWRKEVEQGFRLYVESGRTDLTPPDFDATLNFFQKDAPDAYAFPIQKSVDDDRFKRVDLSFGGMPIGAISHINPYWVQYDVGVEFVMTDINTGQIMSGKLKHKPNAEATSAFDLSIKPILSVAHPSHVEVTDLNRDETKDFIVSDLGSMNPAADDQATLWYLQGQPEGGFSRQALKLGLTRLSNVRAFDHNEDGYQDLVVSDFGFRFTGSIYLLTNRGRDVPEFDWRVLDDRPGGIDTPIVDFDGDGKPDIVTLVSQHHECIDVHLNQGEGNFEKHQLHQASDPSAGSSSLEVIDINGDGVLDILYTNGDTFDDSLAKPYHAIHWLENNGTYPLTHHLVGYMPGVYCARAGDIDLDGDMDIVAVSLLGKDEVSKHPSGTFDGVVWFEQKYMGVFERHVLAKNVCDAAACLLVDADGDGDLDILVPPANIQQNNRDYISLYVNQTK